jgi:hypothetical protein
MINKFETESSDLLSFEENHGDTPKLSFNPTKYALLENQ